MSSLTALDSKAVLLDEAVYSMDNDLYLQSFVLWPLFESSSALDDPFSHYFELWAAGCEIELRPDGDCRIILAR